MSNTTKYSHTEYMRDWRRRRAEAGLCVQCDQPAEPNGDKPGRCDTHKAESNARVKAWRARKRKERTNAK